MPSSASILLNRPASARSLPPAALLLPLLLLR
jgi:hypothetical protein